MNAIRFILCSIAQIVTILVILIGCGPSLMAKSIEELAVSVSRFDDAIVDTYVQSGCAETTDLAELEGCVDSLRTQSRDVSRLRTLVHRMFDVSRGGGRPECDDVEESVSILDRNNLNSGPANALLGACSVNQSEERR